jgi:tetraacyldisaccharide 4'-kinase
MREPAFWHRPSSWVSLLLAPFGALYGLVAGWRLQRDGFDAGIPVFCVGNYHVGGAGKTPTVLALTKILRDLGETPVVLSRGYGGRLSGPIRVDPARHVAADVGDEPLMLARLAPTIVARDRVAGARAARSGGASVIVMDDGFQNPSLNKDLAILVLDGRRGIGNGRVFPAGPLRAPLESQLDHADAMLVIGPPGAGAEPAIAAGRRRRLPRFDGELTPEPAAIAKLAGARVLAFAGIADPGKFFATLEANGIAVAARRSFPDHHRFTVGEIAGLLAHADRESLVLVTTEKDLARLGGEAHARELLARATALPVALKVRDVAGFERMVLGAVAPRQVAGGFKARL